MTGSAKEIKATEGQAIARAHRRGQENTVTIVRFIVRGTIEHENYLSVYGTEEMEKEPEKEKEDVMFDVGVEGSVTPPVTPVKKQKPRMVRSSSVTTLIANQPQLSRSSSIVGLLEETE